MEYLQLAITGLSVVATILAWIAKLRWSQEYTAAKEATIAAKDAQIQVLEKQIEDLRDLTPMKLREYLLSIKEQLEEYNNSLLEEVKKLKNEIGEKENQINVLSLEGSKRLEEIRRIRSEKKALNQKVVKLENEIGKIKPVNQGLEESSASISSLIQRLSNIEFSNIEVKRETVQYYMPRGFNIASYTDNLDNKDSPDEE